MIVTKQVELDQLRKDQFRVKLIMIFAYDTDYSQYPQKHRIFEKYFEDIDSARYYAHNLQNGLINSITNYVEEIDAVKE